MHHPTEFAPGRPDCSQQPDLTGAFADGERRGVGDSEQGDETCQVEHAVDEVAEGVDLTTAVRNVRSASGEERSGRGADQGAYGLLGRRPIAVTLAEADEHQRVEEAADVGVQQAAVDEVRRGVESAGAPGDDCDDGRFERGSFELDHQRAAEERRVVADHGDTARLQVVEIAGDQVEVEQRWENCAVDAAERGRLSGHDPLGDGE